MRNSHLPGTVKTSGRPVGFASNTAFVQRGAYLLAGEALDAAGCQNGAATCRAEYVKVKSAKDAYTLAARIRLAF